jgi:hypothetical protein
MDVLSLLLYKRFHVYIIKSMLGASITSEFL